MIVTVRLTDYKKEVLNVIEARVPEKAGDYTIPVCIGYMHTDGSIVRMNKKISYTVAP